MRLRLMCLVAAGMFSVAAPALAQSQSGSTSGGNSSSFNQGGGGSSAQQAEGDSSSASQIGDTDTVVNQRTEAESGNSQSGSQVTGVGRSPAPRGEGAPSGPGAVVPGGGSEQTDTTRGPADEPFRNVQTPGPRVPSDGPIAGVPQSARTAGDWAVTAVVSLVMLVGVLVGIRKLPRTA